MSFVLQNHDLSLKILIEKVNIFNKTKLAKKLRNWSNSASVRLNGIKLGQIGLIMGKWG